MGSKVSMQTPQLPAGLLKLGSSVPVVAGVRMANETPSEPAGLAPVHFLYSAHASYVTLVM